jgi:chemotaxis methyl-accepting protein methylase
MDADPGGHIARIRRLVLRSRGVDLAHYRESYVGRRIRKRMRARRAGDLEAYAKLLSRESDEVASLLSAISTGVTAFFRDPGLYRFLDAKVLPEVLSASRGRTIRFWSAGCATGEEAYSLAALAATSPALPAAGTLRVVGTDVDRRAIAVARKGEYPLQALRRLPAEIQKRCFEVAPGGGACRAGAALRGLTTFRVEGLDSPPPAGAYDLVLCRNVLIYFDPVLQERIHGRLAAALRPGGYLALGRVERVVGPARRAFEIVNARERVYRRV